MLPRCARSPSGRRPDPQSRYVSAAQYSRRLYLLSGRRRPSEARRSGRFLGSLVIPRHRAAARHGTEPRPSIEDTPSLRCPGVHYGELSAERCCRSSCCACRTARARRFRDLTLVSRTQICPRTTHVRSTPTVRFHRSRDRLQPSPTATAETPAAPQSQSKPPSGITPNGRPYVQAG
jgi:hypothetical protein